MPIFYNRIQRSNPLDIQEPKKWFAVIKSMGKVTEKQVAQEIADEVTLNPKEAEMALYQAQKVMIRALLEGKTFQLGEIGTFYVTASSKGVDSADEVTGGIIKKVNVRFMPAKSLRQKLADASFRFIESYVYKPKEKE